MSSPESTKPNGFPRGVLDAVQAAVNGTYAAIYGEKPNLVRANGDLQTCPSVVGIISFAGTVNWSLSWVVAKDTAPGLIEKFCGMAMTFDCPDLGDAVGELVNVLAGDVVAQLERRGIKAQMSLPVIARGSPLELMPERGCPINVLEYSTKFGPFWMKLVAAPQPHTAAPITVS